MTRRSNTSDPERIRRELIELLEKYDPSDKSKGIRPLVEPLVQANYLLRDLGSSLISDDKSLSARKRILSYLRENVGRVVSGNELMIVAGISEYARRIRELRVEAGWPIISGATATDDLEDEPEISEFAGMKSDDYVLLRDQADNLAADRWKIAKKNRNEKYGVRDKLLKYFLENVGQPVTGEELSYVANISAWARRIRELVPKKDGPLQRRSQADRTYPSARTFWRAMSSRRRTTDKSKIQSDEKFFRETFIAAATATGIMICGTPQTPATSKCTI